ncbi:MAG: hypothetical protein WCF77_03110 [Minisyncoccia bacterium]|jgi:hypothetical protein
MKKKTKKKSAVKKTKRPVAKAKKKLVRRKPAKKTAKKAARPKAQKTNKPIGTVTHFYNEISVAIVRFTEKVPQGTVLYFKGATTDFKHPAKSMQYNHESVMVASKGKQIGIKVPKRVREGDKVHRA